MGEIRLPVNRSCLDSCSEDDNREKRLICFEGTTIFVLKRCETSLRQSVALFVGRKLDANSISL